MQSSWISEQVREKKNLSFRFNRSSAYDVGLLSCKAMQSELFRKIVKCKEHKANILEEDGKEAQMVWQNTNKMLDEGWEGIKTGITFSAGTFILNNIAGACLSACKTVELSDSKETYRFVVVLLGS